METHGCVPHAEVVERSAGQDRMVSLANEPLMFGAFSMPFVSVAFSWERYVETPLLMTVSRPRSKSRQCHGRPFFIDAQGPETTRPHVEDPRTRPKHIPSHLSRT